VVGGPGLDPSVLAPGIDLRRSPPRVADVFDEADAAISAAGSTTWELLCMGVPTALVQVADNQAGVVRTARATGAALVIGTPSDAAATLPGALDELTDLDRQRSLSDAALRTVDGLGASRVVDALLVARSARDQIP
jgi:spore coat polysaccharide biosynthesis predicted glycosyltransferase SpsG